MTTRSEGWRQKLRRRNRYLAALSHGRGLIGALLVLGIALVGFIGPLVVPVDPTFQSPAALRPPSLGHPLGTDEFGRDILARVIHGIRVNLVVAGIGVPIGAFIGISLGLLGSRQAFADTAVQRLFDTILAFPAFALGVGVAAILNPGEAAIIVTIIAVGIPVFGRQARNAAVLLREREFVLAARVVSAPPRRILFRHILPNAADALIVQFALSMSFAVFLEGGMSFVGLGVQLPQPSLGGMLNQSLPYLSTNVNYALGPMFLVALLVVGLTLISDGLNMSMLRR